MWAHPPKARVHFEHIKRFAFKGGLKTLGLARDAAVAIIGISVAALWHIHAGFAVYSQNFVFIFNRIAAHRHNALDVIVLWLNGIVKHHHIAALDAACGNGHRVEHRHANAVAKLVHQNKIAFHQPPKRMELDGI